MRDLDLMTLRLFVTVCETGNIARAAQREALVGSAISKRLAQLEDRLGTPLLQRRRHGVATTPAGEALLEHARSLLDGAARLATDMRSFAAGARGQVRILASVSALSESLADDVADFLKQPVHANIQINMEERLSSEIIRGVREGMASLGICWDATDYGALHARPYRSDHLCLVVPARHPLARRARVRFVEALDWEHVSLFANSALQTRMQREAAALGKPLRSRVMVANFEAALRVVRAGLAVSLVPREMATHGAAAYGLKLIALDEPWAERRFIICHRDPALLSPAAQMLLEHLGTCA